VLGTPLLSDDDAPDEASPSAEDTEKTPRGGTYDQGYRALFPWYRYLFLSGSKPVAHARALAQLDDATLAEKCPDTLKRLVTRARGLAESLHG
jgi:hypothetical protein